MATPERVALSLPVAGIGSRAGAYLLDAALFALFWIAAYFVLSFFADVWDVVRALPGLTQTLLLIGVFAMQWVYWIAGEVFFDGRSVGKRVAGIRVVRLDGSPVTFLESAVRNLLRAVDFLPALYAAGVVTMLVSPQHRRLGDLAAGTVLVRDEQVDLSRYDAPPPARALSAEDQELLASFLDRAPTLDPDARLRLARTLIDRFGGDADPAAREAAAANWAAAEAFLRARAGR